MDRRSDVRIDTNEPVVITQLGAGGRHPTGGMILDMSGSGMLMKAPRFFPIDALVRIEGGNMLLLGEVVRCEAHENGFYVGILIRHSLQNLKALENLNRVLLEWEGKPTGEPVEVRTSRNPAASLSAPIMRE